MIRAWRLRHPICIQVHLFCFLICITIHFLSKTVNYLTRQNYINVSQCRKYLFHDFKLGPTYIQTIHKQYINAAMIQLTPSNFTGKLFSQKHFLIHSIPISLTDFFFQPTFWVFQTIHFFKHGEFLQVQKLANWWIEYRHFRKLVKFSNTIVWLQICQKPSKFVN